MPAVHRLLFSMITTSFAGLALLQFVDSSNKTAEYTGGSNKSIVHELSPHIRFQITLHAFLLWASMGFLTPVGLLIIRMSSKEERGKRLKIFFYAHVVFQTAAVILATAGAIMSIKNFENSFNNAHQKIGLALYLVIWLQPLIGFFRPRRGIRGRTVWYVVHWTLGNGVSLLGIINIYTGLYVYHTKTSRSVKLWSSLFTAEVTLIAFLYLLQDRWEYMLKQGVILGDEPIAPTDDMTLPRQNQKEFKVPI